MLAVAVEVAPDAVTNGRRLVEAGIDGVFVLARAQFVAAAQAACARVTVAGVGADVGGRALEAVRGDELDNVFARLQVGEAVVALGVGGGLTNQHAGGVVHAGVQLDGGVGNAALAVVLLTIAVAVFPDAVTEAGQRH